MPGQPVDLIYKCKSCGEEVVEDAGRKYDGLSAEYALSSVSTNFDNTLFLTTHTCHKGRTGLCELVAAEIRSS